MALEFPSEAWIEEWRRRLNANDRYADVGAGWGEGFNGDFVFSVEADEALDETHHFFVGLEGGGCTAARAIDDPAAVDHGYRMRGSYTDWKRLCQGELGAIAAIVSGAFELDGDMNRVFKFNQAAIEMVETASEIETDFLA